MKKFYVAVTVFIGLLYGGGLLAQQDHKDTTPAPSMDDSQTRRPLNSSDHYRLGDHLFVGGGFVLEFGDATAVGISPILGYKLTDRLSAGVGANYIYLNGLDYYNDRYQTSIYGGSVFAKYRIFDKVFAYAEYGFTSYQTPAIDINNNILVNYRVSVPDFLIGGGYMQQMGKNSYFEILALYDLLYGPYSYEPSAFVFRPEFIFGF